MPQLLQDKPDVFQHDGVPPHIHNEVTTFLNRQLPKRWIGWGDVHFLASAITRSDAPCLFPMGPSERWGLHSTNAYNPEQPEGSNINSNCRNWSAFIAECLAWSRISSWCLQGNKYSTSWTCKGYEKNFLNCYLQWCAFNSCVASTFLPINLCNCSHHL
jgi:hypothetical protein